MPARTPVNRPCPRCGKNMKRQTSTGKVSLAIYFCSACNFAKPVETQARSGVGVARRPSRQLEHSEQRALIQKAQRYEAQVPALQLLYAIPNAAKRSAALARALQDEGMRAGVADLHLPVARHGYHGLWIEMKIRPNEPTQNQLDWRDLVRREGHYWKVCYSADEAWRLICWYLSIEAIV